MQKNDASNIPTIMFNTLDCGGFRIVLNGARIGSVPFKFLLDILPTWNNWLQSQLPDETKEEMVETLEITLEETKTPTLKDELAKYIATKEEIEKEIKENQAILGDVEKQKLDLYIEKLTIKINSLELEIKEAAKNELIDKKTKTETELEQLLKTLSKKELKREAKKIVTLEDEIGRINQELLQYEVKKPEEQPIEGKKEEPNQIKSKTEYEKLLDEKNKLTEEIASCNKEKEKRKIKKITHQLLKIEKRIEKEKTKLPKEQQIEVDKNNKEIQKEKLMEQIERLKQLNSDEARSELIVLENQLTFMLQNEQNELEKEFKIEQAQLENQPEITNEVLTNKYDVPEHSKESLAIELTKIEELLNQAIHRVNNLSYKVATDFEKDKEKKIAA